MLVNLPVQYVSTCLSLFLLHTSAFFVTPKQLLWQQSMWHVVKWQHREAPAGLFDRHSRAHLNSTFVLRGMQIAGVHLRLCASASAWLSIYLLCRITVNHVRYQRDLPIQERGRSQVQWNLVCHHHCDVHSWRNWLNCPTWESTERSRMSVVSSHTQKCIYIVANVHGKIWHFFVMTDFSYILGNMLITILPSLSISYCAGPSSQLAWLSLNDWEWVKTAR